MDQLVELGQDPAAAAEVALAAIEEQEARGGERTRPLGLICREGEGVILMWDGFRPEPEDPDFEAFSEQEALARNPWIELARRETRTFGLPRPRTLARLRELRLTRRAQLRLPSLPSPPVLPRPRERRPTRRRRARSSRAGPGDSDPEPPAATARGAA